MRHYARHFDELASEYVLTPIILHSSLLAKDAVLPIHYCALLSTSKTYNDHAAAFLLKYYIIIIVLSYLPVSVRTSKVES